VIQTEIVVHDPVAQPCDLSPRNFRIARGKILWQLPRRFPENLQVPNHGVDGLLVLQERLPIDPGSVFLDLVNCA